MSSAPPPTAIASLKAQLETQSGWGSSETWSNYDVERLCERILQQTGVSLSVSTLKRVLGKVDYKSAPSVTTLNTLAQFLGYTDWRDFQLKTAETTATRVEPPVPVKSIKKPRWGIKWLGVVLSGIVLVGVVSFLLGRDTPYSPTDFRFTSSTILTQGLPNSVVFSYDATRAHDDDSVFISQSWDTRRKVFVHKNDHHHSAIYYYPGFYRAKLMVGDQVMREHDLQINTDGWLGLVEADWGQQPVYFKPSDVVSDQTIRVTGELLAKYGVKRGTSAPKIVLVNQQTIKGIRTDAFEFETEVKSLNDDGADACQRVEVVLHAKNDLLVVPLVEPGCIGDIYVSAYGYYASSRTADLRGFGCHPTQWNQLRVSCRAGLATFYLNRRAVYQARIKNRSAEIIGVQVRFNGPGAVRNTRLQGATGNVIFGAVP
ncbi:hypothetical protein [Spirosoma humi]